MTSLPTIINLQVATLLTLGVLLVGGGIAFGKVLQWQKGHEKLDDERYKRINGDLDRRSGVVDRRGANLLALLSILILPAIN